MFARTLFGPLLVCAALASGCASILSATSDEPIEDNQNSRSFGSMIDDQLIETKAYHNLNKASPGLDKANLVVVSYNGVVLLAGQVASEELRQLAAKTVADINRVQRVHNELSITGKTSMLARTNDAWITTKVKTQLIASNAVDSSHIKTVTENGIVYLMGLVGQTEADAAAEIARGVAGVQKVVKIFEQP